MADNTDIEYLDTTWNPLRVVGGGYHCTKIRAGCKHCWAEKRNMNRFFSWANGKPFDASPAEFELHMPTLEKVLRWRRPRRVGVQFMGDLFHEIIPFELIEDVFGVMALAPQHTFFVLTKRVKRMAEFIESTSHGLCVAGAIGEPVEHLPPRTFRRVFNKQVVPGWPWPIKNVITGCSISTQPDADRDLPELLRIPGRHWVSIEPGLGMVNLRPWVPPFEDCPHYFILPGGAGERAIGGCTRPENPFANTANPTEHPRLESCNPGVCIFGRRGVLFVAMGGETGKDARPMHPDWVRSMRKQCEDAGVPFHFKHWGEYAPGCDYYEDDDDVRERALDRPHVLVTPSGSIWDIDHDGQPPGGTWIMHRVGRRKAGRLLDGREHNELPGEVQR